MTEGPADHVPLPYSDQLVHQQAVPDIPQQAATEFRRRSPRPLIPDP